MNVSVWKHFRAQPPRLHDTCRRSQNSTSDVQAGGHFDVIIGDLADPVFGGPCYQLYTQVCLRRCVAVSHLRPHDDGFDRHSDGCFCRRHEFCLQHKVVT